MKLKGRKYVRTNSAYTTHVNKGLLLKVFFLVVLDRQSWTSAVEERVHIVWILLATSLCSRIAKLECSWLTHIRLWHVEVRCFSSALTL